MNFSDSQLHPDRKTRTAWGMHLAFVLAALLVWRLLSLHLSELDLYFDEAQYWVWSQEPAFGYFSKPPMIAWLIGATTGPCGQQEFCVRLGAPIIHALTAALVYLAAASLSDRCVAFWAALIYSTTPGVSFSSALISTDVPLLFFWTGALLAWIRLQQNRSWLAAIGLGLCLGLGLLSKYAMVYFLPCAAIWLLLDRSSRWLLRDARLAVILALPMILLLPNIAWNLENGLVTFAHTADNANWTGPLFHPVKALEFFGAQFGVFGPILFGALLWIAVTVMRQGGPRHQRMLLAFSLPVLTLIVIQAFLSRAHANWAAVAYPAASILVAEVLIRENRRWLMAASLALHLSIQTALTIGLAGAASIALPGKADPFWRALGWRESAVQVEQAFDQGEYRAILVDNRYLAAELFYYLRQKDIPIFAWRDGPVPQDHFQLAHPYPENDGLTPLLLVTEGEPAPTILRRFAIATEVGHVSVPAGAKTVRRLHLRLLDDNRGGQHE